MTTLNHILISLSYFEIVAMYALFGPETAVESQQISEKILFLFSSSSFFIPLIYNIQLKLTIFFSNISSYTLYFML